MSGSSLEAVLKVARETKQALYNIEGFENVPGFSDDKNRGNGIITQCAGAVSLLLLHKAFNDVPEIFKAEDKEKSAQIISGIFVNLKQVIEKYGFNATPFTSASSTKDIFNNSNNVHYMGSTTWMLSLCMLIRYNHRKGWLDFGQIIDDVTNKIIEILKVICTSQIYIDDKTGAWGFATNSDKVSLYFTYTVSASLGDYYDYAEEEFEIDTAKRVRDSELIKLIEKASIVINGTTKKLSAAIDEARTALQMWVIKYALPVLPELAEIRMPSASKLLPEMGITYIKNLEEANVMGLQPGMNYNYLYYAVYILDTIISSCANISYKEIFAAGGDDARKIQQFYNQFKMFPTSDLEYYFNNDNAVKLCDNVIEQSIHALRLSVSKASRTKSHYWTTPDAAFSVKLEYLNDANRNSQLINVSDRIKDPVILPLYLRVNSLYSYWITNQPDKIIDEIYEEIIMDRQKDPEFLNLWDSVSFNIMITEKAVESVIDYYNYLKRYAIQQEGTQAVGSGKQPIQPEPIKEAILEAVTEYLQGEKGRELLTSIVGSAASPSTDKRTGNTYSLTSETLAEPLIELIKTMNGYLDNYYAFTRNDDQVCVAAQVFVDFFEKLTKGHVFNVIKSTDMKNTKDRADKYSDQAKQLIRLICRDIESESTFASNLYTKLKEIKIDQ